MVYALPQRLNTQSSYWSIRNQGPGMGMSESIDAHCTVFVSSIVLSCQGLFCSIRDHGCWKRLVSTVSTFQISTFDIHVYVFHGKGYRWSTKELRRKATTKCPSAVTLPINSDPTATSSILCPLAVRWSETSAN